MDKYYVRVSTSLKAENKQDAIKQLIKTLQSEDYDIDNYKKDNNNTRWDIFKIV